MNINHHADQVQKIVLSAKKTYKKPIRQTRREALKEAGYMVSDCTLQKWAFGKTGTTQIKDGRLYVQIGYAVLKKLKTGIAKNLCPVVEIEFK